ncbi:hypothetical protein [Novipirellula artificiosorum]|uniref:HEAT repeat protein n=1 Tax=Novipirellula artificiosorum TaxID=2528016 RepID=A0A5C6E386_9BACT|nr:hypothetical protein [Novipirellula artificiosorum]TWU41866.1 hypothetical protein Poly41_01590 [Novipirellula artificiosorum]
MKQKEYEHEAVPEEWLTDHDPNRRLLAAKSVIMNHPSSMEEAVGVLEELPNDDTLLGARVRRALAKFQLDVEQEFDTLFKLSDKDRRGFVTNKLQKSVSSIRTPNADKDMLALSAEVQKSHCDSTLREFASFSPYKNRTSDAAIVLVQFGDIGLDAIMDGVYSYDGEVRLFSITCVSELLLTHFPEWMEEIAGILDHWDLSIKCYVPRMLWRSQASFALPMLEQCLSHDDFGFAALCAKAIAIIDPSKRENSLKFVEGLEIDEFFKSNLLAELRGEKPYLGM